MIAFCWESRELAPFKRARIVRFVGALPSNPSGKMVVPERCPWAAQVSGLVEQGGPRRR